MSGSRGGNPRLTAWCPTRSPDTPRPWSTPPPNSQPTSHRSVSLHYKPHNLPHTGITVNFIKYNDVILTRMLHIKYNDVILTRMLHIKYNDVILTRMLHIKYNDVILTRMLHIKYNDVILTRMLHIKYNDVILKKTLCVTQWRHTTCAKSRSAHDNYTNVIFIRSIKHLKVKFRT